MTSNLKVLLIAFFALTWLNAQDAAPSYKVNVPVILDANKSDVIHTAPRVVTTLSFAKGIQIDDIAIGSEVIKVTFDEPQNIISIYPAVASGQTNLNIRVKDTTYTIFVIISNSEAPDLRRNYTLGEDMVEDSIGNPNAPKLKPQDIDTIGAINIIERARMDGRYRAQQDSMRSVLIGKTWLWNAAGVTLIDCTQFIETDLLVFKIEVTNRTDSILHIHAKQIGLIIAGQRIPVTACQQVNDQLLPGHSDTVWLFVQGMRISPRNNWGLLLPPESRDVKRILRSNK
jgi:hypothetical protein